MKIGRTILAIAGLVALALTYATRNFYFLIIAIILFFVGLYAMGANRRVAAAQSEKGRGSSSGMKKVSKRKNRKQD